MSRENTDEKLNEMSTIRDLEFEISLIRVLLTAAFPKEGGISQAVSLIRKSSSINDIESGDGEENKDQPK